VSTNGGESGQGERDCQQRGIEIRDMGLSVVDSCS